MYGEQYVATSPTQIVSQSVSQQNVSTLQTLDTHPTGSHPEVSGPSESTQRSWEQVPCGGALLVCDWHMPWTHDWPVVHAFPQLPQLKTSVIVSTHELPQRVIVLPH